MPPIRLLKRLNSGLLVLILACSLAPVSAANFETGGHSFSVSPVPAWVDWTTVNDDGPARPGQALAYRLIDRQVYISDSGESHFSRLITQPLTEAGLQHAAEIEVAFNPAFETLTFHALSLSRNGETFDRLDPADIRLIQREQGFENSLYDGIVTAVIIVDDVRLGDQVDLSYTVSGHNPVFGNRHFSAFALGWEVPVDHARVRVSAPSSRKLYTRTFNHDTEPEISKAEGRTDYRWSVRNTTPVISENDAPTWHQPFPGVQITEYRRWRDVTDWASDLYDHDNRLPDDLLALVNRWKREEPDSKKRAARALKLVQDEVRYFGIEIGQNSHRPSLPGDVYTRRYGDCKDKTALLIAILAQLDIEAWPALVSTDYQREIDNWLPSPGLFDHVVVATRIEGQTYWLDGTRTYQQGSLDSLGVPDFERALIVRKGENQLTPIELSEQAASGIDIVEAFRMSDYDTPAQLTVTTRYRGAIAESMREYFATNTADAITRSYLNYYARLYPSVSANRGVESVDDPAVNLFTTVEHYSVEDFWTHDEDGQHAFLVGSTIAPYIRKPDVVQRTNPLAISYPITINHRSTMLYPEAIDYRVEEPDIRVEDDFVSYHRKVEFEGRQLSVTHHYNARKEAVMPGQLKSYFNNINKISNTLEYHTWLAAKSSGTRTVASMVNTLLDRLDTLSSN